MINQSQLEAAEGRRTHFIFDPCDLHKLLVLENKALSLLQPFSLPQDFYITNSISSAYPQLHFLPGLLVQVDGVQLRPADGLHVGFVALPKVDHLRDRRRVTALSRTRTGVQKKVHLQDANINK